MSKMKEYAAAINADAINAGADDDIPFGLDGVQTHTFEPAPTPPAATQSTAVGMPADMAALMAQFKQQLVKPQGRRIKLVNRVFKFPDGTELDSFRCVIVSFAYSNNYYDTPFVSGVYNPPACFAISLTPKGAVPSKQIENPRCYDCDHCPMNEFGSAPNGRGKACQNRMQIAVLPLDADTSSNFYILDLAPTATKPFNTFLAQAVGTLGVPPQAMSVLVSANPNTTWDAVQFSKAEPLDFNSPFVRMVVSRVKEAQDTLMTEPDLAAIAEAKANDTGFKPVRKSRF